MIWVQTLQWRFLPIRRLLPTAVKRWGYSLKRWGKIYLSGSPTGKEISVSYGHSQIPAIGQPTRGGIVKFQRIQSLFPNTPHRFNILYLGSSSLPADWQQLVWLARRKGAPIVVNQNGVGYPGWHGPGWQEFNRPLTKLVKLADYVFYQSKFCKLGADHFLSERQGDWEILYNTVDTQFFTPNTVTPTLKHLTILMGGNQYQLYRLESALKTIALLIRQIPTIRLLVTGRLNWLSDEAKARCVAQRMIQELGIENHIEFVGPYTQQEAPDIYRRAHILLHTKYNDPCSSTVIEAMACGLPIVYSHSGGTPELVGTEAGIGAPSKLNWEQDIAPDPSLLAEAILCVTEHYEQYTDAARQRAVEYFDLQPWLQRHKQVFERLLQ